MQDKDKLIEQLQAELAEFKNPKNWMRPFNFKGELVNEHALYKPKLNFRKPKRS